MFLKKTLKRFLSPTLGIAIICFALAGASFFTQKPQATSTKVRIKVPTQQSTPTVTAGDQGDQPADVVITQVIYPTVSPIPTQTTTTSTTNTTQTNSPVFSLTINEPDGTNTYTVNFHDGMNACDSLTEAKNEGKIRSLTIDNSYQASLGSAYVVEINGYRNNWTFTADGNAPKGCSLYTLSKGDNIVWKYN